MLAAIVGALLSVGQPPETIALPKARWSLKADAAYCRLERQAAGPNAILMIDTIPGSDSYNVAIAGGEMDRPHQLASGSLIFEPMHESLNGLVTVARGPDGVPFWRIIDIPPAALDDLADAATISLATKTKTSPVVSIPNAAKAIAALRQCSAGQLMDWGADPAQFASGGRPPVASKHRDDWLSKRELLAVMAQSERSDIDAVFRVGVSTTGTIDDCRAVKADTADGVTKVACAAVMNKVLFAPATDPHGHPVRGVATFRVVLASRPS